ncbi:DUF3413 domain-containing protein [Salmonella enterica subsp. enterica]|nr:DUF3413 domain-containing protein [Salmonella enterica subsp. enterica]
MPHLRYSDEHVEQLLSELLSVLEKHMAPTFRWCWEIWSPTFVNTSVAPVQRRDCESFCLRLAVSITTTRTKKPTPRNKRTGMVTIVSATVKSLQMVSWGHWFALFNILLVTLPAAVTCLSPIGRRNARVAYTLPEHCRHFSFLVFASYLLILFRSRLSMSQRLMRFETAILATAGMTLLLSTAKSLPVSTCILIPLIRGAGHHQP